MYTATIPISSKEAAARPLNTLGVAHTKIFYNAGGGILVKIKVTVQWDFWGSIGTGFERKTNMYQKRKNVFTFKSTMITMVFPFSLMKKLNNSLHISFFDNMSRSCTRKCWRILHLSFVLKAKLNMNNFKAFVFYYNSFLSSKGLCYSTTY